MKKLILLLLIISLGSCKNPEESSYNSLISTTTNISSSIESTINSSSQSDLSSSEISSSNQESSSELISSLPDNSNEESSISSTGKTFSGPWV